MIHALLLSFLATADPCTQVSPLPPDPDTAKVYREIGDAHRDHGELALAAVAYRDALRRAPDDAELKADLQQVCHPGPSAFARGQTLFDRGDFKGAIPLLEQARAETGDPAATLLLGIARYQVGDLARARPLLEEAAKDADLRDSARFFLGLVALGEGERGQAISFFDAARADPALAKDALALGDLARADARLQLSVLLESTADSNPTLLPTSALTGGDADVGGALVGLLLARPFGVSGPYLRLSGVGSLQANHPEFDLGSGSAAAGYRLGEGETFALLEYAFLDGTLGRAPYLLAHRLQGQAQLGLHGWLLGGAYDAQRRDYQTPDALPYSGWAQRAQGDVGRHLGEHVVAFAGYRFTREDVTLPELSYVEHAPWAELRVLFTRRFRLFLSGDWAVRLYDAPDAELGVTRVDHVLEGSVACELDLSHDFTVRLSAGGTHQLSVVPAFRYDAATLSLGLQYTAGFF